MVKSRSLCVSVERERGRERVGERERGREREIKKERGGGGVREKKEQFISQHIRSPTHKLGKGSP